MKINAIYVILGGLLGGLLGGCAYLAYELDAQRKELLELQQMVSRIEKRESEVEESIDALGYEIKEVSERRVLNVDSVKARRISLVGSQGRTYATLEHKRDITSFTMTNGDPANSVMINVFEDGRKALLFRNESKRNRIALSTGSDGVPRIALTNGGSYDLKTSQGFTVAKFSESDAEPYLSFFGADCDGDITWTTAQMAEQDVVGNTD